MPAPKRNSESAKFDYEPISQWGPGGADAHLVEGGEVNLDFNSSPDGVGHGQPDPYRHLDDQCKPEYP